jgi:hypothetical protein
MPLRKRNSRNSRRRGMKRNSRNSRRRVSKKRGRKRYRKRRKKSIKRRLKKSPCKRKRKVQKKSRKKLGYKRVQMGCAKQRGGNCTDRSCEYPENTGEIITGIGKNLYLNDLTPQSTQQRYPQHGAGFDGLGTSKFIDFGGSGLLTTIRNGINSLGNVKQTWNADRKIESSDPVDKTDRMDNN